jgi:two-component system, OmpR family, sensor histidine kinase KdpD
LITHVVFGQSSRTQLEILMKGSTLNRFLEKVKDAAVQSRRCKYPPGG